MLVNVVRLCRLGETLPPDELETATRVRGHLFLTRWRREVRVNGETTGLVYEASLHRADDNRLPPGEGSVDWHGVMQALKNIEFEGYLTMEIGFNTRKVEPDRVARSALAHVKMVEAGLT